MIKLHDELKRGDRRAIEAAKNITSAEKKVLMNVLKTNQEEFEKKLSKTRTIETFIKRRH